MSIVSFNFSTSGNKEWMASYNHPLQIMPQTTKIPTDNIIENYPDCSKTKIRDSVIHTSYITRPFNDLYSNGKLRTFRYNIKQYTKLCKRLNYKRLLIHLPQTDNEMNYLGIGMNELINLFSDEDNVKLSNKEYITLVLEIPAFKAGFNCDVIKYFEIIISNYFDKFKYNNVELCFDTAHIFANGIDCNDMVKLFETKIKDKKLIDYCKIIHFNGNKNVMGKSDIHVQMFSPDNKLTDTDKLVSYLKDKNKILISENTTSHSEYDEWVKYAKTNNLNIVPNDDHISA